MKNLTTYLVSTLIAFGATSCSQHTVNHTTSWGSESIKGSKNYVTKDIRVDNFTAISLSGSQDVIYTQKPGKHKVEIYTSDNIVDLLDIQVKNKVLVIKLKKGINLSYDKLEIRVNSEDLKGASVAGSGSFTFTNGLRTSNNLSISVAGSGDIEGENLNCKDMGISIAGSGDINIKSVECNDLEASVAGSGDMEINKLTTTNVKANIEGSGTIRMSGSAQEASFSITGSGDLFANNLPANRVSAGITGSGNIKCHAIDYLKVRTSGSGRVGYKGNPKLDVSKKGLYKL